MREFSPLRQPLRLTTPKPEPPVYLKRHEEFCTHARTICLASFRLPDVSRSKTSPRINLYQSALCVRVASRQTIFDSLASGVVERVESHAP